MKLHREIRKEKRCKEKFKKNRRGRKPTRMGWININKAKRTRNESIALSKLFHFEANETMQKNRKSLQLVNVHLTSYSPLLVFASFHFFHFFPSVQSTRACSRTKFAWAIASWTAWMRWRQQIFTWHARVSVTSFAANTVHKSQPNTQAHNSHLGKQTADDNVRACLFFFCYRTLHHFCSYY